MRTNFSAHRRVAARSASPLFLAGCLIAGKGGPMHLALGIVLVLAGPGQETTAPTRVGLAAVLQGSYAGLKSTVIAEAAAMPQADYGSKPSAMPEVRTFAQVIAHIAESQFDTCARVKRVPNPGLGKHLEQDLKTKADVEKALADSFTFCDE